MNSLILKHTGRVFFKKKPLRLFRMSKLLRMQERSLPDDNQGYKKITMSCNAFFFNLLLVVIPILYPLKVAKSFLVLSGGKNERIGRK